MTNIVIINSARTPQGNLLGSLKDVTAAELGSTAIKSALGKAKLDQNQIDEVFFGCVLPAGQGQAPARQASLGAGLPNSIPCTTVNKMCGSGMKAVMLAFDSILAGTNQIVIAGGMESMSNAPYLMPKARQGYRLGHAQLVDHLFLDGLEDAYDKGKLMGYFAENTAKHYGFTREQQDEFAVTSLTRAKNAIENNYFKDEIAAVLVKTKKSETLISVDENPMTANIEKIKTLNPAFSKDGTITAANSSSISDGASALILASEEKAKELGLTYQAKIIAHASHAHEPAWFTTAPVSAIKKVLAKANWSIDEVDLFEINEAFAVVTMAAIHDLKLDQEKVNIFGGACALGHPIGASGARIITTLVHALKQQGKRKGIAALCIGGGEATAIAIEVV